MRRTSLAGRSILIAEDEPLIALSIADAFTEAGAHVVHVRLVGDALVAAEDPAISAAIIDHGLSDGDSSTLCERLSERHVPYVIHSGYPRSEKLPADVPHVPKPADPRLLVTMVGVLLEGRERANTGWPCLIRPWRLAANAFRRRTKVTGCGASRRSLHAGR